MCALYMRTEIRKVEARWKEAAVMIRSLLQRKPHKVAYILRFSNFSLVLYSTVLLMKGLRCLIQKLRILDDNYLTQLTHFYVGLWREYVMRVWQSRIADAVPTWLCTRWIENECTQAFDEMRRRCNNRARHYFPLSAFDTSIMCVNSNS